MKSSWDIDSVWAGGAVLADNVLTCTGFNEFLYLSPLHSYLSPGEQRIPTPASTTQAIAVLGNFLLTPQLVWGFG